MFVAISGTETVKISRTPLFINYPDKKFVQNINNPFWTVTSVNMLYEEKGKTALEEAQVSQTCSTKQTTE